MLISEVLTCKELNNNDLQSGKAFWTQRTDARRWADDSMLGVNSKHSLKQPAFSHAEEQHFAFDHQTCCPTPAFRKRSTSVDDQRKQALAWARRNGLLKNKRNEGR
jgi:hypothetical protein